MANSKDTSSGKTNSKTSEQQEIYARMLNGKRPKMKMLPGFNFRRGYGFQGMAEYKGTKYHIYGADCGGGCACAAVAIHHGSELIEIIEQLTNLGLLPYPSDDEDG